MTRSYPTPAEVSWPDLDTDALLVHMDRNRVTCFLAPTVAAGDPPAAIREYLKLVNVRQRFAAAQSAGGIRVIAGALDEARIPWLVFKGPALSQGVYLGAPRESSDIDLLIDGVDLGDAIRALERRGAVLIDQNFDLLSAIGSGEIGLRLPGGATADLHWHFVHELRVRRQFTVRPAAMLARRTRAGSPDPLFDTLDATDTVLQLCLHACLSGGDRLLWLKDIDFAVSRLAWSPDQLVSRSSDAGVGLAVAVLLHRVSAVLGTPIGQDLLDALAPRSFWRQMMRWLDARSVTGPRPVRELAAHVTRCTRATSAASMRELAWRTAQTTIFRRRADSSRPWRIREPGGENPTAISTGPASRQRFYDEVRLEASG